MLFCFESLIVSFVGFCLQLRTDWDASGSGAATSSSTGRLGSTTADVLASARAGVQAQPGEGAGANQAGGAAAPMDVDAKSAENPKVPEDVPATGEAEMAEDIPQV